MKGKRIVFRADGNSYIGMGHIMRCIALAQMLDKHFEILFIISIEDKNVEELLSKVNYNYSRVQNRLSVVELGGYLSVEDILVVDGYNFDSIFQMDIKKYCCKLVYIDDLINKNQVADLVINHAGGVDIESYAGNAQGTKYLLGPQFALLRNEFFLKNNEKQKDKNGIKTVLINFGGADPLDYTRKALEALLAMPLFIKNFKIIVILGKNYGRELILDVNQKLYVEIKNDLNAEDMVRQILESDLVICSASTIAYEVATINRPICLFQTAQNQEHIANFFERKKLAIFVERNGNMNVLKKIFSDEFNVYEDIVERQRKIFDGKSNIRILNEFLYI